MVKLKIDNFEVEVPEGTSILEAARQAQIDIPTLCKHPDVDPSAGCGMCIVKVNGRILRSCCTPAAEGMEVITGDAEIVGVRRTVLELILSNHPNECLTCIRSGHCELQDMANSFGIAHSHLPSLNKSLSWTIQPNQLFWTPQNALFADDVWRFAKINRTSGL
ncbi:MAG: 2Fe-2S iron-sulfur cluster-binding protein [Alphaproteobacteria bacterium]